MIEHPLLGMNHVTAMASDPQAIFDFMSKTLGLHLIKKTVTKTPWTPIIFISPMTKARPAPT